MMLPCKILEQVGELGSRMLDYSELNEILR